MCYTLAQTQRKILDKTSNLNIYRVATKMENMKNVESSGILKNCQNLRENSGKLEFLLKKPGKLRENVEYVA